MDNLRDIYWNGLGTSLSFSSSSEIAQSVVGRDRAGGESMQKSPQQAVCPTAPYCNYRYKIWKWRSTFNISGNINGKQNNNKMAGMGRVQP